MNYSGNSYKIEYQNHQFDSIGELTWYLFLLDTGITNNIISQPLAYKKDLSWYPDLSFSLFTPAYFKIYIEVKPLTKESFSSQLNLTKYKINDSTTCIVGLTYLDYLILDDNTNLTTNFDKFLLSNQTKWDKADKFANDFAHKYGTFKKSETQRKEIWISFGKYKGYSLTEMKQKDKSYYNWYIETFDPII